MIPVNSTCLDLESRKQMLQFNLNYLYSIDAAFQLKIPKFLNFHNINANDTITGIMLGLLQNVLMPNEDATAFSGLSLFEIPDDTEITIIWDYLGTTKITRVQWDSVESLLNTYELAINASLNNL